MEQNLSNEIYESIIVGGGFAGITAARELSKLGHKVLVLEGRDRLGGRTWTDHRLGTNLEIGGTWVHWSQPHVWSEITRYGLEVFPSPEPNHFYWISENKTYKGTMEDYERLLDRGMTLLLEDSLKYFPKPYEPLSNPKIEEVDHLSITDRLNALGLSQEEYDVNHAMWATNFSGAPEEGGLTQGLRWGALGMGDWKIMLGACNVFKLKKGTRALIEAIAEDAQADIKLSSPVVSIKQEKGNITVSLRNGQIYHSQSIIVTAPLNALNNIDFQPELSEGKVLAATKGQAARGVKVWARVRGDIEPFLAVAPGNYPLTLSQLEYKVDGDSIIVGLGPDASRLDPTNQDEVEAALRYWLPDVELVDCTGHDWTNDEFSRETWPMHRPHHLTSCLAELQDNEKGLFLAGSDYCNGWGGFIDGAIESGITVGRKVHDYIKTNYGVEKATL